MIQKKVDQKNFIRLLQKKDERALDYVIETYGGLIQAIVRRHLFSFPDKCGECVNDILLAVWNEIGHFDSSKNEFSGWLAAICKYKAIDTKRRSFKLLAESPLDENQAAPQHNPEETVLAREISEETESLLLNLPPEERKLFWDCYVEREPVENLAKERNLNASAIYNHLSRDKKKLRRLREVKP